MFWLGVMIVCLMGTIAVLFATKAGRRWMKEDRIRPLKVRGGWVLAVMAALAGLMFGLGNWIYFLMPVAIVVIVAGAGTPPLEYWGFTRPRAGWWRVVWLAGLDCAMALPVGLCMWAWIEMMRNVGLDPVTQPSIAAFHRASWDERLRFMVEVAVLAPMVEEVIFTGFLYPWLKGRVGRTCATIIDSLVFAVAHMHLTGVPHFALSAVANIWVYELTGRLSSSMLLHGISNLLVTVRIVGSIIAAGG